MDCTVEELTLPETQKKSKRIAAYACKYLIDEGFIPNEIEKLEQYHLIVDTIAMKP